MQRALQQLRAADALRRVKEMESQDDDQQEKYVSYVNGLPATILINGLGQAAATLLSAAKGIKSDPHYFLYRHLQLWLCREEKEAPYAGAGDLMQAIVDGERGTYQRAQVEALAWLEWVKKFANAYLKKGVKR
ncbi:CRISPR-associated protein Cmr5 [Clostridiales bacterium PH28_bin88]|nr:CRISPR-associated protein Cmr5 [Clostridiales bacterium PH28_bin88]